MNSLRKKYPFQLGKSFFKADSWLSLEVIAVLAIITTLSLLGLKLTADYLYKVAFAAPLSNQFIDSRIQQQEYYAWHGRFDPARHDFELMLSDDNLPHINQQPAIQSKRTYDHIHAAFSAISLDNRYLDAG